jgi:processive 1,2-diacylglycerol beta-glucosyltransferase
MKVAPRILVLSAAVGAGHLRAAQAVELALREVVPDATVANLDVLEMTNAAFRRLYAKAYLDLVNKAPHVLGYFYDLLDKPRGATSRRRDQLLSAVQNLNLRRLIHFLRDDPWDLVINTHFLPAEIIATLRRKGRLETPQVTVTTDFETHRLWVNQPCEHYFTATAEGALYLHSWGVPADATTATGIPVHPVFAKPKDRDACLKKHGLHGDRPVVLQLAGGFGVGPVVKLHLALRTVGRPAELVVVAGRNEKVRAELEALPPSPRHHVKVIGFTHEIDELMAVADLVVSKPGGLTTSETLARGAVMVIVNPIPGQESRNSDFLLENGAAIKVNNLATLAYKVGALLEDPRRLAQLKANVARIARPRAAYDVVRGALQFLAQSPP